MPKLHVFIGSSQEAVDRKILTPLVLGLSKHFEVLPWYADTIFPATKYFLESLLRVSENVDNALLIFANDDRVESRGTEQAATRDNVVLEFGLFLSKLGRERVAILMEKGVTPPTDLSGVNSLSFQADNDVVLEHSINKCVDGIIKQWHGQERLPRSENQSDDGGLGVLETLEAAQGRLKLQFQHLSEHRDANGTTAFHFHSQPSCLLAYAGGLSRVQRQFLTTTFLTSGFWVGSDNPLVIDANRRMNERLKAIKGDVRRLVILTQPLDKVAAKYKEDLLHHRRQRDDREVHRLKGQLEDFKRNMLSLADQGCEVRVAYDERELCRSLPPDLGFDSEDSELALYDDFRLDIYNGGKMGRITDAHLYCRGLKHFDAYRLRALEYFEGLWKEAHGAEEYLARMGKAQESAFHRIQYASNWLARYQFGLDRTDEHLKVREFEQVTAFLKKNRRLGKIRRFLDVGTCTGRYLLGLRHAVIPQGEIVGIDDDEECVDFATADAWKTGDQRIKVFRHDFCDTSFPLAPGFDLITCMLGTLSHFGWDIKPDRQDSLQSALQMFAKLIAPDGFLIIGKWSRHACESKKMLAVYNATDVKDLARWTPSTEELTQRLANEGFLVREITRPEERIEVFYCVHEKKPGTKTGRSGARVIQGVKQK